MTANEIRKIFLDFFAEKQHQIVPSAPIVVKNDPTLMFVNSGMAPFKDIFLGNSPIKYPRIADSQKCLRVSGKHNDLEEVGIDTYHHTMFEMLGNWSFGDYFKKEAIAWSWELLTEIYKIPVDRIYVTVFEGDIKDALPFDIESFSYWQQYVAEDRILRGNKKDNFWEMGEQGPCGPCSEIHVDCRPDHERLLISGASLVNNDDPQVIEIWNNVFMQYNRLADGSLHPLPAQHVDTGMGFERLVRVLQEKTSNYDTDIFQPIIQAVAQWSNTNYGSTLAAPEKNHDTSSMREAGVVNNLPYAESSEATDIAMRVIADHIRTISFTIADGQLPGNAKAGYVIRRILRRAVRYGFQFLEFKKPFLYKLVPILATQFKEVFPELKKQEEFVAKVILEEENSFLRTLEIGLRKLDEVIKNNPVNTTEISGNIAFELYDTFGFPLDLTQLILRERGLHLNQKEFDAAMDAQKNRARNATAIDTEDWIVLEEKATTEFVGYDTLACEVQILKYRKVKTKSKEFYQLVFNTTPFYAESGGQVGDTGTLVNADESIVITDTKKENNLPVHLTDQLPLNPAASFTARVDASKRQAISSNHSATHLIHAALKEVLGAHVNQKGSLVNDEYLRFDISHFQKVSDEEIERVEKMVSEKIRENIALEELRNIPLEEARQMGATALFGEKYGDQVRVIIFDKNYSMELCGGTHVPATGQIGLCKIIAETAVAAGVRRIEAITSQNAIRYFEEKAKAFDEVKSNLNNSKDVLKAITDLKEENASLKKKIEKYEDEIVASHLNTLKDNYTSKENYNYLVQQVTMPSVDAFKNLTLGLKQQVDTSVTILISVIDHKPMINIAVSDSLVSSKTFHAGNLIKELALFIKGGGGGQPGYASAGGNEVKGIDAALIKALEILS
ncbi:MAG: alanine--tRNA ligase [Bacteroidetes bacterium]|nr:alanine--tRNA ligase [Bacteroidota bacterium]